MTKTQADILADLIRNDLNPIVHLGEKLRFNAVVSLQAIYLIDVYAHKNLPDLFVIALYNGTKPKMAGEYISDLDALQGK